MKDVKTKKSAFSTLWVEFNGICRKFSRKNQQQLQPWQWFALLYLLGFSTLLLLVFLLKMLIKAL
jgi:hypothetical protein